MIRKFTGKIPSDNVDDALISLLSAMTGLAPSEIQITNEIRNDFNRMVIEREYIKNIVSPFYDDLKSRNTKDSNKKIYELIDLGKFLYFLQDKNEIKIIECDEKPDFIIQYQNELIGVEHTGIYDNEVVAEINNIKKIIKKCQDKLNDKHIINGFFNIIIMPDKLKDRLASKDDEIIEILCNCIIAKEKGIAAEQPDFIVAIIKSQHSTLELALGEDYWLKELSLDSIKTSIIKKEGKINSYKNLKNIDKCWLLIVLDGASSLSSFSDLWNTFPKQSTSFDRVFIFNNFEGKIVAQF